MTNRRFGTRAPLVTNARHGWKAKVQIREHVMAELGAERTIVFDAFAGAGIMWREVWSRAAGYVGCDERWHNDERRCFVADNRRVLRCIDLAPFTIFDADAYGSPWEALLIIAARRKIQPGERIALVLTEGTSLKTRWGSQLPNALSEAAGLTRAAARGAGRVHDEIIGRALAGVVDRMGGRIVRQWRAMGTTTAAVRYLGVVLEGQREAVSA
ncbi:MAG: hypothetical protein Q8S13_07065 [Dehalococcoidia bacterium]|nr:hypothetical protein [Dehalococcoidia bacterium]